MSNWNGHRLNLQRSADFFNSLLEIKIGWTASHERPRRNIGPLLRLSLRVRQLSRVWIFSVSATRAASLKLLNAALENGRSTAGPKKDQRDEIRLALLRLNRIDRDEQKAAWARNMPFVRFGLWTGDGRTDGS